MSLKENDLFGTQDKLARAIARIRTFCTGKKALADLVDRLKAEGVAQ